MRSLHLLPTALLALFSLPFVFAASPTSFCKCTCGTNSTIIPLDGPLSSSLLLPRLDDRKGWPLFSTPLPSTTQTASPSPDTPTPIPDKNKEDGPKEENRKEYRAGNCADCNRQFCLSYMNLPICKGKLAEEIFTTCFQRDSRKDEAVVYIFIVATAGLLLWAAVKPWVARWVESARERRSYIPVAGEGDT
ncbi:MAG: hypothetical protein Q9195_006577 [Heterodermia aff. obscurata]